VRLALLRLAIPTLSEPCSSPAFPSYALVSETNRKPCHVLPCPIQPPHVRACTTLSCTAPSLRYPTPPILSAASGPVIECKITNHCAKVSSPERQSTAQHAKYGPLTRNEKSSLEDDGSAGARWRRSQEVHTRAQADGLVADSPGGDVEDVQDGSVHQLNLDSVMHDRTVAQTIQ
jgi:hypothetical protein